MTKRERAAAMQRLFFGRVDIYGLGAGKVVKAPVTIADFADHLEGKGTGLGIFPLRSDGTVSFAAVDLDEPDFETAKLIADLLPGRAYIERSRSGNAHVWVFFDQPIEAWAVRGVMRAALESIGRSRVEVFPKQDRLRDEASYGNYINLPLHGGNRPVFGWQPDGWEGPLAPAVFLEEADRWRTSAKTWRQRAKALGIREPSQNRDGVAFGERKELHECAIRIYRDRCERPLVEGHRDVVLFNFAKQVLNWEAITPDEARGMVDEVNACSEPPLPREEVDRVFRNATEKRYTSTGCDDPLMEPYVDPDCPIFKGAN